MTRYPYPVIRSKEVHYLEQIIVVHSNNCVLIIFEGGVSEACRAALTGLGPSEDSQGRGEGGALLCHGVVTGAIEVVHLVVEGEDVHVPVEVTVAA